MDSQAKVHLSNYAIIGLCLIISSKFPFPFPFFSKCCVLHHERFSFATQCHTRTHTVFD